MDYLKPGGVYEIYSTSDIPVDQVGITPIYKTDSTASMNAISASSKNPYRVMKFLNLLFTNEKLSNLLVYGIEGTHYTKKGEDIVELIDGSGYNLSSSQWMFGNVFLNHLTTTDDPNKKELLKEFNEVSIPSPLTGLNIALPLELDMEKMLVSTVNRQFRKQAVLGAVDPDETIRQYISELKAAGIDKIIEECQRQYDEWKSEN